MSDSARSLKEPVLTSAVEFARVAAEQVADSPTDVGEHLGVVVEGERLASHRFACGLRGYVDWAWVVTLSRVPRSRSATVCEVELMPGEGALLAPKWVPWSERLRPGDIGPGDVLPFQAVDPRLEPGWKPTGDKTLDEVAIEELAMARVRVLAPEGRELAAKRWYRGAPGPKTPGAVRSTESCLTCGFFVRLSGPLGQLFGVCANEWSSDDGKVVSVDHGCGAHSESDAAAVPSEWPDSEPLIDELAFEAVDTADGGSVDEGAVEKPGEPGDGSEERVGKTSGPSDAAQVPSSDSQEEPVVAGEPEGSDAAAEPGPGEPDQPEDEPGAADGQGVPAGDNVGEVQDGEDG